MAIVPVEILGVSLSDTHSINNAIKIINSRQQGFKFDLIEFKPNKTETFFEKGSIHANDVYTHFDYFKSTHKGFHPYLIGVIEKRLEGFVDNIILYNLFCAIEKKNGTITGKGVITTFDINYILPNTPLEIYLIFYFLSASIRFLSNEILIHDESRDCPFDLKMSKLDLRGIIRKGQICHNCLMKINNYLDDYQLQDINVLLNLTSQISNSSNPQKHLEELLSITERYETHREGNNHLVKQIIEERIVKQTHSKTGNRKNEVITEVKKMIGRGNLKNAIEELLNFLNPTSDYFNETILLYARFNNAIKDFRKGIINLESKSLEFNRINDSFLQIIDEI